MPSALAGLLIAGAVLSGLFLPLPAIADANVAARHVPDSKATGTARMTFLFWDVYDATLYAPGGVWQEDEPFALSLAYKRKLRGKDIAKRSIEEMQGQGFNDEANLAAWYKQMEEIFPDVDENTTLTGVRDKRGYAIFYHNGGRIGVIEDPDFSYWFFGIWLNEKTSEAALRKKLLGVSG